MAPSELTSKIKAHAAALRHGRPASNLQVITVVGRDGGGATVAFLAEVIKAAGERVGIIAQDYVEVAGERAPGTDQAQPLEDPYKLNALLAQMRSARCTFVLIEVAGQLPVHAFAGISIGLLVVRRIADDRLDQVSNANAAVQLKKLIRQNNGQVILPRDDSAFDDIREACNPEQIISYGTKEGSDSQITKVQLHPKGSAAKLVIDHQTELEIVARHPGKQAVYNMAAAATAAYAMHVPLKTIEESIAKTPVVSANCEYLPVDRPYKVVLDSSVTPQGIAEVLESLKHFAKNRLIVVIAANLAQPASWRGAVGETVASQADRIVVTDGDYLEDESPQSVRAQLLEGISHTGSEAATEEVEDRQAGIEKALALARRGDTIVLCAVTTRPYRQMGADHLEWSDRSVISELV